MALILDSRAVSRTLVDEIRSGVEALSYLPRLVFIRAGDDPASASYVRSKVRLAARAGIETETVVFDMGVDQHHIVSKIEALNSDPQVDGILVQLPLYSHLDSAFIVTAVEPSKDVDGIHPINVGKLWMGEEGLAPATPSGLIRILEHYRLPIEGNHVVIVGRSNLVGKPAAALFLRRHGTVTLAHSRTRELPALTRQADILVAAAGSPGLITPDMVQPGAVVLDVGQAVVNGVLQGDVAPEVADVASGLTPTPGGTGPMTVAMVILNTVTAAERRRYPGG